jgi:hypothetical protein
MRRSSWVVALIALACCSLADEAMFGKKENVFIRLTENKLFKKLSAEEVSELAAVVDELRQQYKDGTAVFQSDAPEQESLKIGQRVGYSTALDLGRIIYIGETITVQKLGIGGFVTTSIERNAVRLPIGKGDGPASKYKGNSYRLGRDHHHATVNAALSLLREVDSDNAMCGKQFIFSAHKLLLHVEGLPARVEPGKTYKISIVNLTNEPCKASRLSIWMGVRGPQLHGGAAVPDEESCSWSYELKVDIAGEYVLDVRLLHWDGHLDTDMKQCNNVDGMAYNMDEATVVHTEPRNKGRFYGNELACCELCTRMAPFNGCKYWTWWSLEAPGGKKHLDKPKCALFSAVGGSTTDPEEAKERKIISGVARTEAVKMYLGSSMPFHHKWCRREDEIVSTHFTAAEAADDADASAEPLAAAGIGAELDGTVDENTTPLCKGVAGEGGSTGVTTRFHGRWVSYEKKGRATCNDGEWARSMFAWPCCKMMFQVTLSQ